MKFSQFKKSVIKKAWPIGVVLLLAVVVLLGLRTSQSRNGAEDFDASAYQDQLQSQVDSETGEPRDGRDPATQQQTSLESAASSPTSNGQATQSSSGDQEGLNVSGCYYDYGDPGQCVPAHAATNGALTCAGIKSHGFPNGVKVAGTDRFHLDTNHDGTACGSGD